MQLRYQPAADRLLWQLRTTGGELYAVWLTRRMVRLLWPPLVRLVTQAGLAQELPHATVLPEAQAMLAEAMRTRPLPGASFAQAAAPKRGGVLKVSANANPSSLDPATGGAGSDHTFLWTMYDTLVEWDYETLKAKPGMAAFNFPDPRTLVLDIKPGILFQLADFFDRQGITVRRGDLRRTVPQKLGRYGPVTTEPATTTSATAGPATAD